MKQQFVQNKPNNKHNVPPKQTKLLTQCKFVYKQEEESVFQITVERHRTGYYL